jgi:hypothetical protein
MKSPPEEETPGNRTTEDRWLLTLLFEPQKAGALLSDSRREITSRNHACDWPLLVEKSRREGVASVLFHNLTHFHLEDRIPPEILAELAELYHITLKRNLSIIGKVRTVLAAFQETGITCILLKGIALAEHVYPNVGMRGMSDVDLLVRKEALFKVDALLSSLGYHPEDSSAEKAIHNPAGYLASLEYRGKASPVNLHVHWHTVNTSVPATMFIKQVDIDRLWEQAIPTEVADSRALMLRPEHMIIYLCEHALRIGHSFDRLILVCDIYFFLKSYEGILDWAFLVEESRWFNLSRFLYHSLSIVRHYTGLEIPERSLEALHPSDLSRGERLFVRLQFGNRRIRGSSYPVYLKMVQGLPAKVKFIFRTLFPPRQILLQRQYRKEAQGTGVLYLSRIREILSSLWGVWTAGCRKSGW